MNFLKKNKWASFVGVSIIFVSLAYATVTYKVRYTTLGTEVFRIESDGGIVAQGGVAAVGPWKRGNTTTGTAVTMPTTTTGSNFAGWVPVYNPTGSSIAAGTVLISSDVANGVAYVNSAPATTDLTTIIGVAAEAIAATSKGWMVPRGGGYAVVKTTGTVNIGDTLVSTTSAAGYLTGDATPTTGADVGTALSAGTAAGGSILALLH